MTTWNQNTVHTHMEVYSSDEQNLGHVADVYEDSFAIHKGVIFAKNRYIPYTAIAKVDDQKLYLTMSADEVHDKEWDRRPDYEDHLSDPVQLMYDRGHGVHDPFDETDESSQNTTPPPQGH
jgi:hypothetical protein